jgi:hypothetical protein
MKLPILNLDEFDVFQQVGKVTEEITEWEEGKPFSENDIEETLDVMQAMLGYLLKIVPDTDELQKHFEKHCQKLIDRGWEIDGHVELKFHWK